MVTLDEYQALASKTAVYPVAQGLQYTAIGLAGEVGEYCNKVKKIIRGDVAIDDVHPFLAKELGGVLWYLAACAREIGYDLEVIANINLGQLQDRAERGVIKGDGDDR